MMVCRGRARLDAAPIEAGVQAGRAAETRDAVKATTSASRRRLRPTAPRLVRGGLARARAHSGVAVVEFAVLVPALLLIVLGILDFGRAMNYKNELTQLANQAARFAAVNRNPADGSSPFPDSCSLRSYLSDPAHVDTPEIAHMIETGTVAVTTGSTVGDPVTVKLTTTFSFLGFIAGDTFGIGKASSSLSGEATMRLEQVPTFGGGSC